MEDLLVGSICWSPDLHLFLIPALPKSGSDVLNMSNDHVGAPAIVVRVLSPANGADVRGDTCVDYNVFLASILINIKAAEDEEAVAEM